ncbi:hypothetical protein NFI96_032786 [Prochilodus magdalenae]|nr:hypothetical protein NFI96_032786 [Prochilodus magdalenae]
MVSENQTLIFLSYYCINKKFEKTLITLVLSAEISSASSRTHFIIEGGRLSYSCLHNLSLKVDWTFQAYGENTVAHLNSESTNKTSLVIPDVQPSHAGNYSCWRKTLNGKKHKVLSVSVCVLTDATAHIAVNSNPLPAVIVISTCTAALLITVALVITVWVRRRRVNADRNSTRGCQMKTRSSGDEDQTQVIYSVVEVGKHIQQNVSTSDVECVYSQIKL